MERPDPRHKSFQNAKQSTAKQTVPDSYTSPTIGDQPSPARARVAVLAALAPLSVEQRRTVLFGLGAVAVLVNADSRHLPLKAAAARAGVSLSTMTRWTERFGLGRRVGGRWQVDGERLDAFLAERPL